MVESKSTEYSLDPLNTGARQVVCLSHWGCKYLFTIANQRKRKHEQDTARKITETYKRVRLQKKYNLQPAIADKDYGPEATAPNLTTQSELHDICKEFLKSLQVTETHVAELAKSTAD